MIATGRQHFAAWLRRAGAEVMQPTNPYEWARFVAHGATQLVYTNAKGELKASGFARQCLDAFLRGQPAPDMGIVKRSRQTGKDKRLALLQRDGNRCFYCGLSMPEGDQTIEHLIAIDKGGSNHMENLVLAHEACNKLADNRPIIEKIAIRDELRGHGRLSPPDIEQRLLGNVEREDQGVGAVG